MECERCEHKEVCGKRISTGGKVKGCKHFREIKIGRWIKCNGYVECSMCHVCGSLRWNICPVCETRMEDE